MSVNYIATVGSTLGFGENIDNHRFVSWNFNATDENGNGFTINRIFAQTLFVTGGISPVKFVSPASRYQTSLQLTQNFGTINDAIISKSSIC